MRRQGWGYCWTVLGGEGGARALSWAGRGKQGGEDSGGEGRVLTEDRQLENLVR